MGVDEYFGTIILILEGLSFIAILLIFLYMIYGEKEERGSPTRAALLLKILSLLFHFSPRFF
jgi:hypothetical protein